MVGGSTGASLCIAVQSAFSLVEECFRAIVVNRWRIQQGRLPMVKYSDEEARNARQLAVALLQSDEPPRLDFDEGFSIIDIQADAVEFRDDIEVLAMVGADVPAISITGGPLVPVSLVVLAFGGLVRPGF